MIQFHTSTVIYMAVDQAWNRLVDFPNYPGWNPFNPRVEGVLRPGARLKVTARLGQKLFSTLHQVDLLLPNCQLSWKTCGFPGWLLIARRHQVLEPLGPGKLEFFNRFEIGGLLAGLVNRRAGPEIRDGMELMGNAFKKEVESNQEPTLPDQ